MVLWFVVLMLWFFGLRAGCLILLVIVLGFRLLALLFSVGLFVCLICWVGFLVLVGLLGCRRCVVCYGV